MKLATLTVFGALAGLMVATPAVADTVTGAKAKSLIVALKFAKVAPTKAKDKWTFKADLLSCHSINTDTADNLPTYDCQIDKKRVFESMAMTLMDAMIAAGITFDDHMEQSTGAVTAVACVNDQTLKGDDRYQCTFTTGPKK